VSRAATILVTDADRASAVSIIRSLGRKGWRVIASDSNPRSIGFRSRYAHDRLVYPEPETAPDAFVDTVCRAAVEKQIDLVVPVTDEAIFPLSHARERLEPVCRLAVDSRTALEVVTDKARSLALAQELNVPVPRTRVVATSEEAREAARDLEWPIVLKPAVSRLYRPEDRVIEKFSVAYAENLDSLMERMRPLSGRCKMLLQEYCPGVGEGVELLAHEGRVIAAFQHRRLAEVPLTGGASAWRESVPLSPELYSHASRLVEALRWTGLIMTEFKVGERSLLMEINGRIWNSLPLAILSGVDFPCRLAEMYLNGPPSTGSGPISDYRIGVRAFHLEFILSWLIKLFLDRRRYPFLPIPKRRQALSVLWGLLSPRQKLDLTSREDVRPVLAQWFRIVRKSGRKLKSALPRDGARQGRS